MGVSKATTNERRVKSLKDTIAVMKKDGSITQHAYDSMVKVLDGKGNGLIVQPEDVYVGRTEVPDEIPTPLEDVVQDPAPTPALEGQLPHDDEPVALPLPGDEAVDVSPQVDEPELVVEPVPVSAPDPDPELVGYVWGNLSSKKKTKKGEMATKKKKRVSSILGFEDSPEESVVPEPVIEHKSREEVKGSDEEWGEIEMPDKSTSMDGDQLLIKDEEQVESVPQAESPSRNIDEQKMETMKGCLFMDCISCSSMILIQFENQIVPPMPLPTQSQYENGIVMTTCKTCDSPETDWFTGASCNTNNHVDKFASLRIHSSSYRNSDIMTFPELIVGEYVRIMKYKERVLYMNRDRVMEKVTSRERISSLNMDETERRSRSKILLPYLRGGFV